MNTRFKVLSEGKSLIESFATSVVDPVWFEVFLSYGLALDVVEHLFGENRSVIDQPT